MLESVRPQCATLLAADLAALAVTRPDVGLLFAGVRHPYAWVAEVGTDGAAAQLAQLGLWLCSAWVLLAFVAVAASRLPGAAGQLSAAVAGCAVPGLLRRAVAGSIGVSVLASPLAACATPTRSGPAPTGTTSPRQVSNAAALVVRSPVGRSDRALGDGVPWPRSVPTTPRPKSRAPIDDEVVVVRPGDSLWAIAARRLGPEHSADRIATYTRRWYDANARTIGSDPNLIHPGQHLHRPEEKGAPS